MMRKKPMLAYPVSTKPIDYSKLVFMQPKLDGVRCVIQYDAGKVTAYSRTGKEWKNIDHILLNLYKFFNKHPNVILDGELYNHNLKDDFEKIISLVRKQKPTDIDALESADMVQFHCYDIINKRMKFNTRNKFIKDNLEESYCVKHVDTLTVFDEEEAQSIHRSNLKKVMKVLYYVLMIYTNVVDHGHYVSLKTFKMLKLQSLVIQMVKERGLARLASS